MSQERKKTGPKKGTRTKKALCQLRKCLGCRAEFLSEGIENRMCLDCRDNYKGLEFGKLLF